MRWKNKNKNKNNTYSCILLCTGLPSPNVREPGLAKFDANRREVGNPEPSVCAIKIKMTAYILVPGRGGGRDYTCEDGLLFRSPLKVKRPILIMV